MEQDRPTGMCLIQRAVNNYDFSHGISALILDSWRPSTKKQYSSYLLKWNSYCAENQCNPSTPKTDSVLGFLYSLFCKGLGYSSINTAKSALISLADLANCDLQKMLLDRFMKGVFHNRPSLPKYQHTWDINIVLGYLKQFKLSEINLKMLTIKTLMLLALLTGQRGQTLHVLKRTEVTFTTSSCVIMINSLLKTSTHKHHLSSLHFDCFCQHESSLCVVHFLKLYIERTSAWEHSHDKLFLSYVKPHKPVSRDTISRWIRSVMQDSGIDVSVFSPHSTRAASTSAAKSVGVPMEKILKAGHWSNAQTFARFYDKHITLDESQSFTNLLLLGSK